MDYVYICRSGDNEELRYSLRSIEKNMPNGKVWLVGNRPEWYIGELIYVSDIGNKFDNIRNCIEIVSSHPDISENFILMNDDFFALNKMNEIPTLHGGLLLDKITRYKELRMPSKYIRLLELTYKQLVLNNIVDPIDYDIHVPMVMNKNKLKDSLKIAYFPRSAYGNYASIGGEKINDVKIYGSANNINLNNYYISTEDRSFIVLKNKILKEMFSEPGKLENPAYSKEDKYVRV
jgi:hypothetical protein